MDNYGEEVLNFAYRHIIQEDDDIIAQQAALAQAKFGGLKAKGPMVHDEVSIVLVLYQNIPKYPG